MKSSNEFNLKRVAATAAMLFMFTVNAGPARAMNLADAYHAALANDPASLASGYALVAGREKAVQGDALLKPRVNLEAGAARVFDRQTGSSASTAASLLPSQSSGTTQQAVVRMVQPLYDRAAEANRDQLHEQGNLARIEFSAARQTLALHVADAYFGVLVAQETVQVAQAEYTALRYQRDRAKVRFDVGQDKITDVEEAQARLDAVSTRVVTAMATLEMRRSQFREITGLEPDGLATLSERFVPVPPQPARLDDWQARGEANATSVLARRSDLAVASAELSKNRLASRPTLDLVGSVGAQHQNGSLSPLVAPNGERSASIGLMLTVPLYAGGAIDSRQREAVARMAQKEQDLAAARRDARLQVQEGYLAVLTGVSRIAAQEQAVASARSAMEATSQGRDVGTRTALDVLDAQQRYYAAQLELVQGRVEYLQGRLRLAAAAGELDEGRLREMGPWLAAY